MKQIKYLIRLKIDCEWTDEELKDKGFEIYHELFDERIVIYRPLDRKTINSYDIDFWEDIESIEAFDELEQIKGQLEFEGIS